MALSFVLFHGLHRVEDRPETGAVRAPCVDGRAQEEGTISDDESPETDGEEEAGPRGMDGTWTLVTGKQRKGFQQVSGKRTAH